ncbi:serpentine type 7TM GPCR receptor class ab chemoreceptor domain-containing protein [Ditylenchus destructor]|nr:serpentine type 7TM GPCR receptor class ab chemoreceptor domain-containing protein [Ditylenchus destructor]
MLVVNVIVLYVMDCVDTLAIQLRYLFLYLFYRDPCELLTEVSFGIVLRLPSYMYMIAFTFVHCTITAERAWATIFAKRYEKVGCFFGIASTIFVWTLTFVVSFLIVYTALLDKEKFAKPMVYLSLTTTINMHYLIYLHYFLMFLVIMTSILDYVLIVQNRRYRQKNQATYSLSMNYQLRENVVTMKLILPLDISFTIFFSIYLTAGTYLRSTMSSMTINDYMCLYEIVNTLFPFHTVVTLFLYMRYVKAQELTREVDIQPFNCHKELYFKHLQTQWS